MSYDEALAQLRAWVGRRVVVLLEPETAVMKGVLAELPAEGIDGALFGVDTHERTGIALALFRDAMDSAREEDGALVVEQGVVTLTVTPTD